MKKSILFIDCFFLKHALEETRNLYSQIWNGESEDYPKIILAEKISLHKLIEVSGQFAHCDLKKISKAYLITENENDFEIFQENTIHSHLHIKIDLIFNHHHDNAEMERILLNDDDIDEVILLGDSVSYNDIISENIGDISFKLMRFKHTYSGIDTVMPLNIKYQNISYPLGICLGLRMSQL